MAGNGDIARDQIILNHTTRQHSTLKSLRRKNSFLCKKTLSSVSSFQKFKQHIKKYGWRFTASATASKVTRHKYRKNINQLTRVSY
jgi:hypothetical protein